MLTAAWRADPQGGGFCVPNPDRYPWQWLWDSCFHAVIWANLGDERALLELSSALRPIDPEGFVPHIRYVGAPATLRDFWGREETSSITQPPMYGHALATCARLGLVPPPELVDAATSGIRFLLERRRRTEHGLVELCHPWESGCDDSPRWDGTCPGGWSPQAWYEHKGALLSTIERSRSGAPLSNPGFGVGGAGFTALVAFNARELADLANDDCLLRGAEELAGALAARWDPAVSTWVDDGATAESSGRVRTVDALLPLVVSAPPGSDALAQLTDGDAFGAPYGPTGLHRSEPEFDPRRYWRGSAWPQLTYLLWLAAVRSGSSETAAALRSMLVAGAEASGFAEHWDPDTATALGAVPQTWSALAWVVSRTGGDT